MPVTNVKSRWNAGKLEFYDAASGTTIFAIDGPNLAVILPALGVNFASQKTFISGELTATGSAQNVAHGLGVVPAFVVVVPTDTSPATVGVFTVTEGVHTTTNAIVTVTASKKFKVMVFA